MQIQVVKSKIHRVKVTGADLNYIGSITIDEDLMDAAVDGDIFQDPMTVISVPDDVYIHSGFKGVLFEDM